jgi:hypothetical protein
MRVNIVLECRDIEQELDMAMRIPESSSSWLVDGPRVIIIANTTLPPRDPDDDDDADDEDDEPDDDLDQAVIREPDEQ